MGILKGKLVRKDDKKILQQLDIQDYPWLHFKEKNIVTPDNPRRSVILKKFHDPKEMREKVRDATEFLNSLEKKTTPIYPIDLTKDYEKGLEEVIKQKRRRLMGEEEAMAMELAEIDGNHGGRFRSGFRNEEMKQAPLEEKKVFQKNEEKIPEVEQAPAFQMEKEAEEDLKMTEEEPPKKNLETHQEQKKEPEYLEEKKSEDEKTLVEMEKEFKASKEKGYELGYLEGFKNGEERALHAQESKYESVFQNISHVIDQMEKLKDSLYAESKEVFLEILKLCSEKIIREQIKYSDTALFSLFDEVLKFISQKSSLKIELNSQDLPRLKNHIEALGIQDRVVLKEDNEKASGDFNIESERGISIVSLSKTVENLVEKLKSDLFSDDMTHDSNDKKAG